MDEKQREFAHLVSRQMSLRSEIEQLEAKLNVYEALNQERIRYGGDGCLYRSNISTDIVEKFLSGDWQRTLDLYKIAVQQKFLVDRRLYEITNNSRNFY